MVYQHFHGMPVGLRMLTAVVGTLLCVSAVQADEFRAFWVDAWGAGFRNQTEVEALLGQVGNANSRGTIRDANCNAVIVQVRRRADVCYPSAVGEPYFSGLSPSNYNALQAMINAAHDTTGGKQRIEVHAWLVAFATGSGTSTSAVYYAHDDTPTGSLTNFDNYWPTRDDDGVETEDKAFDPGHPKVLEYLTNVCMDLVNNYDLDGIHYDYIRFTGSTQGYNPTSVARYNARYGLTGQPASSNEQFKQWRRDQVTALVRRVYAHIQASKPWVRQSGSFVTWNPSPVASTRAAFRNTRPYYDVYSDWDSWMEEGILDFGVPMTYYNWASLPNDYTRWMNFQKDRKGNRHMVVGPGIYLNSLSNAILEIQKTRDASPAGNYAQGFSGYSYRAPYSGGSWAGFAPTLLSQVTPTKTNVPAMPWKTNPTVGHMMGTVTLSPSNAWADGATVSITGPEDRTMTCDGTGFYAFIDLLPGNYTVTASYSGYPDLAAGVAVSVGQMSQKNFLLGVVTGPQISNVQAINVTNNAATITWTTDTGASSQVQYGPTTAYGSNSPLDSNMVTSHSVNLTGLSQSSLYHYRVLSTNATGTTTSTDFTFNTQGPPQISNVQSSNVTTNSATITWTTNAPASSRVNYGLTSAYGSQSALLPGPTTSHTVNLSGLTANTLYHYQAVSANAYGSAQSVDLTFQTDGPPIISGVQATDITAGGATITWTTQVAADSQVEYGPTAAYGFTTVLDTLSVTSHSVALTGLLPAQVCHYRVRSANPAGTTYSADQMFTTLADVAEIVIDNLDPGWTNTSPGSNTWSAGSSAVVPKIGTNYLYRAGTGSTLESSATHRCRWTPDIVVAGLYDVYVFYQLGTNRTTGAIFTTVYDGGEVTSQQNQYASTPNQGDWFKIGSDLPFALGTSGYVELGNNAVDTALVSADAAKFVYKGSPDQTAPSTPMVSDQGIYTASLTDLYATWETSDPETGVSLCEYRIVQTGGGVIRDWTSVGAAMSVTATGLNLQIGASYVFEVRATNGAASVSAVGSSDGIAIFRMDIDSNGKLDAADMASIIPCLSGDELPYPSDQGQECDRFDRDLDEDVDLDDFAAFQRCISGSQPINLNCQH